MLKSFGKSFRKLFTSWPQLTSVKKRETIQSKIDEWHLKNKDKNFNKQDYTNFLKSIAYIHEEKKIFK